MAKKVSISAEARDVINRATFDDSKSIVKLPEGQLDRKVYLDVKKGLESYGGKWKGGKVAGFVFAHPEEYDDLKAAVLGGGDLENKKQDKQQFHTPEDLANEMAERLCCAGHVVLEPSIGHGALADAAMAEGAFGIEGFDIDPVAVRVSKEKGYAVEEGDFLKLVTPSAQSRFKRIIMNPPFTKNQDVKHVERALKWLAGDGILVAIMFGNQERPALHKLFSDWVMTRNESNSYEVEPIEPGRFKSSGTGVGTIMVTFRRQGAE